MHQAVETVTSASARYEPFRLDGVSRSHSPLVISGQCPTLAPSAGPPRHAVALHLLDQPLPAQPEASRGLLLVVLLCFIISGYIVVRESNSSELRFWWDRSLIDWTNNPLIPGPGNPYSSERIWDRIMMPAEPAIGIAKSRASHR